MQAFMLLALCVACVAKADARRIDPVEQTVGQATTVCGDTKRVIDALHDEKGLGKLHDKCTWPLIYLGYKHQTPEQAKAYCKSDACVEYVKHLKKLPACTWKNIPSDSDDKLLAAKRVLEDCG